MRADDSRAKQIEHCLSQPVFHGPSTRVAAKRQRSPTQLAPDYPQANRLSLVERLIAFGRQSAFHW
jgi:hypothetical protein